MDVYQRLSEVPRAREGRAIAIGVFDGVHLGHQSIIQETVEAAGSLGVRSAAVTFDPHPESVLRAGRGPRLLTTQTQKAGLLSELGVTEMLVVKFDREFARLTPEAFCDTVLADHLEVKAVLVGEGFRFGRGGSGTAADLDRMGVTHGFATRTVPLVVKDGAPVSSTRIRGLLSRGDVRGAADLLGRLYRIEGRVSKGRGRGRSLGAPTANIDMPGRLARPRLGVYVTRTTVDGERLYASVTSVGTSPTFEERGTVRAETFLLEFEGDVSGSSLRVDFLERLRGQRKFPDADALAEQIAKDVEEARMVHAGEVRGMHN